MTVDPDLEAQRADRDPYDPPVLTRHGTLGELTQGIVAKRGTPGTDKVSGVGQ